jgi:exodeoxyribonuclease VII large subunit
MLSIYQVTDVANYLRELLESNPSLSDLWIEGEISNLSRPSSGHTYFTLKDERAALRCVMFRSAVASVDLTNGAQVVVHGRLSFYETRGDIQLYVDYVHAAGVGILHLQFERLKTQLESEGLFEAARKRPLPAFPQRIGVVTSPSGAVFHDICNVLARRWPLAEIVLMPTFVQGDGAVDGIISALQELSADSAIEVIILARGGGSLEELWAFNEEAVARAVYASHVPVVTGVGHETDYTIVDFVADRRAPTPSAAAELVAPNWQEVAGAVRYFGIALATNLSGVIAIKGSSATDLRRRLSLAAPDIQLERQRLDDLHSRASRWLEHTIGDRYRDIDGVGGRLNALNPAATLKRGYSIVNRRDNGRVVSTVSQVKPGDLVDIHVGDGQFPGSVGKQHGF